MLEHLEQLPDVTRSKVEAYLERHPGEKYKELVMHLCMHWKLADFWEHVPTIEWNGRRPIKSYADNPEAMSPMMVEFILQEPKPCRFLDFGAGTGCVAINLAAVGYDVVAVEMNASCCFGLALGCVENDVYVDIRRQMTPEESLAGGFAEACFSRTFYTRAMARENMDHARALRDAGVKVWIGSDSIFDGTNRHVEMLPGEIGPSFSMPFPGFEQRVNHAFILEQPHAD